MTDPIFFKPSRSLTVGEAAQITGASLRDGYLSDVVITKLASIEQPSAGAVVFVGNKKHGKILSELKVAAVFCSDELVSFVPKGVAALITKQPQKDFSIIGRVLFPEAIKPSSLLGDNGISPQAYIHPTAKLEENVTVEAGVAIGRDVEIGSGTVIAAGAVIGANCRIGRDCYISSGVSLQCCLVGNRVYLYPGVRIGQDGFGYLSGAIGIEKIPQLGCVIIQDDVEIGANTTIDRGALSDTVIGEGTKIDNLVQIAHNVRIGRFCIIAAHTGIAGSVTVGDMSVLGGRVGISDHVNIGSKVQIAASSGVMNDIPDGEKWGGIPARPFKQWFREVAALRNIGKSSRERS